MFAGRLIAGLGTALGDDIAPRSALRKSVLGLAMFDDFLSGYGALRTICLPPGRLHINRSSETGASLAQANVLH